MKPTLTFLDTETTGLPDKEPFLSSPELGPEVTEYAIATWCDGETTDVEHKLIMPRNYDGYIVDLEGIARTHDGFPLSFRPDAWKGRAVHWNLTDCQTMRRRLDGQILAGSNPAFDMAVIAWEHDRAGVARPQWQHRKVDTNGLGIWLWLTEAIERTSLVCLAQHFEIKHDAHTSRGDCLASIQVFERLFDLAVYQPRLWADALREIVESSPDVGMAEFAARALAGDQE